jgi:hypothetical protein
VLNRIDGGREVIDERRFVVTPSHNFLQYNFGTFYATEGSRMRFDADNSVLYAADGSRYFFGAEQTVQRYNSQELTGRWATSSIDRNGNTISYSFSSDTTDN